VPIVKRSILAVLCLSFGGAALGAAPPPPQPPPAEVSCTRGGLQNAVNLYLAAQTKGDLSGLPLANGLEYRENIKQADIRKGFITRPLTINFHRSFFDDATCQSYTEIIVNDPAAPYVLGTRLRVNHAKIAEIEIIWTAPGYWLFNAENYFKYSSTENWEPIPAEKRDTRGTLISAANAYLDAFLEKKIDLVPWGFPCVRIEGGAYTGKGTPSDSCEVGVPGGVNIVDRRFVVDEVTGTVAVFCTFGAGGPNGSGAPDLHLFRIENGKLRYVHTLTHLLQANFRGNNSGSAQ
jgi:hypothetical protein